MLSSHYLLNSRQAVKVNNIISSELFITQGAPQGSVLGPILFTLLTADLSSLYLPMCRMHQYADDVQLYVSCRPLDADVAVTAMNDALQRICEWSESNELVLNPSKSVVVWIETIANRAVRSVRSEIKPGGIDLETKDSVKNLGVVLECNLNFQEHVLSKCRLQSINSIICYLLKLSGN